MTTAKRFLLVFALAAAGLAVTVPTALAAPIWSIDQRHYPTHFVPGAAGQLDVHVDNEGQTASTGPVTVVTELPPGMTASSAGDGWEWTCTGSTVVTCQNDLANLPSIPATPNFRRITINVDVDPSASGRHDVKATVSGGGAVADATITEPIVVSSEPARFGAVDDSFAVEFLDEDRSEFTQAGGHPYTFTTIFEINTRQNQDGVLMLAGGALRNLHVDLPTGFTGNPNSAEQCPASGIYNGASTPCPRASQIGKIEVALTAGGFVFGGSVGVYNMKPADDELAALGFNVTAPIHLSNRLRSESDYGITTTINGLTEAYGLLASKMTLWGVPADPRHDRDRFDQTTFGWGFPSSAPPVPYFANPATCDAGPRMSGLRLEPYAPTGQAVSYKDPAPPVEGCNKLTFNPTVDVETTSREADAPTGLQVDMGFPQYVLPNGLDAPPLKDAVVELPGGMTISPSAADGLQACSDAQLGVGTAHDPTCPDAAKIGTVTARTPSLEHPLEGHVYVGEQRSDDPESGEMFRMFLVLRSRTGGLTVKLPGQVRADSQTGRLRATFARNPQQPLSELSLRLRGGPRAPLATPAACGTYAADWSLASWGGQQKSGSDSLTIDQGCGTRGFAPRAAAGSTSAIAGAFSPFALRIDRDDREQSLSGVKVDLPEGLLAKLAGVPLCESAQADNGGCPAGSRVGSATVAAGPGASPYQLPGDVYLTTGYKGAPYGLAVHVHAKAGPFDLGWVRVRQALHVDRRTAQVSAVSDPLPQIVKGVPVRLRSVNVDVDRPKFTVNPTSCKVKSATVSLTSVDGATHRVGSRFQAGECSDLAFKPKLALRLTGKGQRGRGAHPGIDATLTQRGGQANIDEVKVTLPEAVVLDAKRSADPKRLCTYEGGQRSECPASSKIGTAVAKTPLLDRTLSGPVYFVQGVRFDKKTGNRIRTLPTLLVQLRGQIAIDLRASSSVSRGRLVTTFADVPDAAVERFRLKIAAGPKAILTNNRNVCSAGKLTADVDADGQNGKRRDFDANMKTPCPAAKKAKKKGGR